MIYHRYNKAVKKPCVHPAVQIFGVEWHTADEQECTPNWLNVSLVDIQHLCQDLAAKHCDWHPDLTMLNLGAYLKDIPSKKQWWQAQYPAAEEGEDGVSYPSVQGVGYALIS